MNTIQDGPRSGPGTPLAKEQPAGGISLRRWMMSGIAAGLLIWLMEGAASAIYLDAMIAALEPRGLALDTTPSGIVLSLVVSLLAGLTLIFLYAAVRPRFGPGPRTAVTVAIVLWAGSTLIALIGYRMLDLFPLGLLASWGATGLVEFVIAALAGGWIYRESTPPIPSPELP